MARPRTASNILELKGAFKHNPQRGKDRAHEPKPNKGIGPPPAKLRKDEKDCWDEIVSIVPAGVLGDCDRAHLELVAKLLALSRRLPIQKMPDAKLARLMAGLGLLGLNPADRSKVRATPAPPKNEFADL